jgi:ADP-heptose:LPS heptosyltransferase
MKKRHPVKKNVLLVNITRLGDMLQATPTIAGIKLENPDCKITVLVEKQFEAVCHVIPNIDEVMSLDLAFTCRSIAREQDGIVDAFEYLTEMVEKLRAQKFDYCLNMSSSAYTALLLNLVGITKSGGWTSDGEGYRVIESEWARLFATSVFHQNRQYNSLNLVDVFRCSADIEQHPQHLLIHIEDGATEYCETLLSEAKFTNTGPLIAVQAGASQGKRQWDPSKFVKLIGILVNEHNARVVLTGAGKESVIIDPIVQGCNSPNVISVAGKTSVPQLAAMLKSSDILVTGDTGPMHMAVAVGTPVVSMFLASAFGFETGPYSEDNLVLQPVIGCGPCNPNKPCARPDCHDTIAPELVAHLTVERLKGPVTAVSPDRADPQQVIVYRSVFDSHGFCDLVPVNGDSGDPFIRYREAYRKLWLDDLGGFEVAGGQGSQVGKASLAIVSDAVDGLKEVSECAAKGQVLISELVRRIQDVRSPAADLGRVNGEISELDREIEQLGFHYGPLGPLTRMFVFAKENLAGTDAIELASQMKRVYQDLERRCEKFASYHLGR